jgi:hypothetical protein
MPDGYAPTASLHAMGCTGATATPVAMSRVSCEGCVPRLITNFARLQANAPLETAARRRSWSSRLAPLPMASPRTRIC